MVLLKFLLPSLISFSIPALIFSDTTSFQNPESNDVVMKIGLLIADNKSLSAQHGAEMAIHKANENGGFNGIPFKLVVRSMGGLWGTGSKQAVNLIFEEKVVAIMGSHDGRNAHLVEQVSAKARIVFLSAWSGDPTLSQAFIPWFFSCVPNYLQQASALIEEIYNKRKINKVATVSDNDYNSKMGLESFLKKTKLAGKTDPLQYFYEDPNPDFNDLTDQINKADVNCIVLFGQPSASSKIIQQIRQKKMKQQICGTLSLLDENELSDQELKNFENILLVPSGNLSESKSSAFQQEYQKIYNKMPGMVAACAFDGMNLLIEAIRNAGGPEREKIQKSLSKIHYEGITGSIQFDDKGNRSGTYDLMGIRNGLPVALKRH
jgi:branched-chain amino acid transport system substrate-binding protein